MSVITNNTLYFKLSKEYQAKYHGYKTHKRLKFEL